MWYDREKSSKIHKLAKQFPILVLTGSRQVGKSSLLKKIFPHHQYISLDLSNLRQIGQGITLFSGENDGRLPPSSCKAETQEELELSWIYSLRDYLVS